MLSTKVVADFTTKKTCATTLPNVTHHMTVGTNVINNVNQKINSSPLTATAAATTETISSTKSNTTTTTKESSKNSSYCVLLLRNALRTFQILLTFLHCFLTLKLNINSSNSNNTNKRHQKQPQLPPMLRLKFRRNSYCNRNSNRYNVSNSKENATKILNTTSRQYHAHNYAYAHSHGNRQQMQHNHCQSHQHFSQLQHHCEQPQIQHRVQQQHNRHYGYFKMPNLSKLYIVLIILSFLSIFLPSTQAQKTLSSLHASIQNLQASSAGIAAAAAASSPVAATSSASNSAIAAAHTTYGSSPLSSTSLSTSTTNNKVRLWRNETVCKSMDIRNTPVEFRQLKNCTVIEGFLMISLLSTHTTESEFTQTFPLLTEVTEFIIVYNVQNLRSLSQIFPNLSIIRGRQLLEGYAFVVFYNPQLEDLGLSKLTSISRGGVRIENNLSLCFVDTVDWMQIVSNTTDIVIKGNRALSECPKCPGDSRNTQDGGLIENDVACKEYHGRRLCWNSKSCQKICPERCRNNCLDENTCCNESCLGGCAPDNLNSCISCRHYSIYNNTCTDKCPSDYFSYLDRRCLTDQMCAGIGSKFENNKQEKLVPFDGVCSTRCPEGYNKIGDSCDKCGDKCTKKCVGDLIDSVARAKEFHGCTHIVGEGLTISIKRGGRHLMEDLEFGLSSIEVITTFLKVHRTFGMFSLEYFKNLKTIKGEKLCEDRFALYVLENNDLETIWGKKQNVRIEDGRVFFHFNPKLCYAEIESLRPMMRHNQTFDRNEVATDSNGSKGSCNTELLNATIFQASSLIAIVDIINPLQFDDERTFIGYQYFFIEDKYKNASKHGHRPCDDGWTASEPTKETRYIFQNLKPFTQYAYYVKTMTISTEPRNAQSPIQFFKTKSAQPEMVRKLRAYASSDSEIVINWLPPLNAYGNLTKYKVRAVLSRAPVMELESRNFCKDPLKEAAKIDNIVETKPVTEKPLLPDECKCRKDTDDVEFSEASRHDDIDFENALQNFIYVKRPNDTVSKKDDTDMDTKRRRRRRDADQFGSFLIRHMRAAPDELDNTIGSTALAPSNSKNQKAAVGTQVNQTRMDPNNEYMEIFFDTVNASTTEYVFRNLKHFSIYMLGVEACREPEKGATEKECSAEKQMHVRTQKMENVDRVENLQASLETANNTRSSIRLRWDLPVRPNGAVVSYTIAYIMLSQDAVEEKKCIVEQDYRKMINGYLLTGLSTGNYSIRVRANSLAGEGVYSEPVYMYIPPTQISTWAIVLICIAILAVLCIVIGATLFIRRKLLAPPSDLKMFPTVNPYYISLRYIPDDWEVPRDRVIQLSPLGQGSFGMVCEGILKGYDNSTEDTACAIKTVNENATDRERLNFLNEASVMKQFDTYHVVRLLGVCSRGQPALVVMELMKNGDLKSYLRAHRPDERDDLDLGLIESGLPTHRPPPADRPLQPPPLSRLYQMAIEIADGMAYLSAKKYVHRDLAARNCMVAADLTVKIGDFGMTRDIYETDYYRKGTKGLLPVRWMPPESLRDGVYSSASDVFSYGVVLWEMATLASQPYQGLSNDQVLRYVIDGGVMERPEKCPDKLYRLMQKCWHHRPSARPSFMEIITYLLEGTDPHFREVSFYHSDEGEAVRAKELAETMHHSGDVFNENENDMDDVTTPLRLDEYNEYKLNMDNNSSVENHGDIDDDHPHSPYSIGSAPIISSTPDGQSKNSYNIAHQIPSTAIVHTYNRQLHPGGASSSRRYTHSQTNDEDAAAYVQPDFDENDAAGAVGGQPLRSKGGKSSETDERGYEIYDPSPNYREHVPSSYDAADDEDDFKIARSSRSGKLSGAENLLPYKKAHQRVPTILPMSSSMPDDVISAAPMSSSLHPSTASAASSNASSNATATGKYPSLKRAVADTVQNVSNSLMPSRLRNINRRFFNHKRSGSNASHKSTSSNPNTSSNSNTNLTSSAASGRGKSTSGQNLGTIESGGSGSAGSYCANPRFFTPATTTNTATTRTVSENPNYQVLNETANTSAISTVAVPPETGATSKTSKSRQPTTGFLTSLNPNYKLLNESLNTTATPTRTPYASNLSTSENPNYQHLQQPASTASTTTTSDNPSYVMMNAPEPEKPMFSGHISENPNYQIMGPTPSSSTGFRSHATQPFSTLSAVLRREQSRERFHNSATPSSSSVDDEHDDDPNDDDHDIHTEHIKMERIPLSRRQQRSNDRSVSQSKRQGSRSRSRSSQSKSKTKTKSDDKPTSPTNSGGATKNG